jgi:hypothetical protein
MSMFKPDFSSLPKNPIWQLRNDLHRSITELSRITGVGPQVIRDLEIGLPQNISYGLIRHFSGQTRYKSIDRQYQSWRRDKRNLVELPPVGELKMSEDTHPFIQYLNKIDISPALASDYLCIPRFVILHWVQSQRRIPRRVVEALTQAHLSEFDIKRLANHGEIYYDLREGVRIREQTNRG